MRKQIVVLLAILAGWGNCDRAAAHPASGIVVNPDGEVFFIYSRHGVMKLDTKGKLTQIYDTRGGHWMTLDAEGSFSRIQPQNFRRITPDGAKPAILFADGGAPLVVNRDGNLYYGSNSGGVPGGLTVTRMTPAGELREFAPALTKRLAGFDDGVTGLAEGPNGDLYVAAWNGVLKVKMDGTVTTVAYPVAVADCDENPPDNDATRHTPYLRGIAVDAQGTVYVAAAGCRRVLKITPDGQTSVILKSERPWSPTGVTVHGSDLYILEYNNPNSRQTEEWVPRVRKLSGNGDVRTLVTISASSESATRAK